MNNNRIYGTSTVGVSIETGAISIASETYKTVLLQPVTPGINTLTQSMVSQPDTKYLIRYDFALGEDIVIPENCVLEFDGGSISGGTITFSDTIVNAGNDRNNVFVNVIKNGTYKYNVQKATSKYESLFSENNMIDNPFFNTSDQWTVSNCSITDRLNISGKGWVYQTKVLSAGHRYLAVCYAKISSLSNIHTVTSNPLPTVRCGIGFRIKDDTPVNGDYRLNIDFVGNLNVTDFVPIIYTFDVLEGADANIYFGEMYDSNGSANGQILHAGLYDITNDSIIPKYSEYFKAYKKWVEEQTYTYNPVDDVVFPETMAINAFLEEEDIKASYAGLYGSKITSPYGGFRHDAYYNNGNVYKTYLEADEKIVGYFVQDIRGGAAPTNFKEVASSGSTTFRFHNINPSNTYFVKGIYTSGSNVVAISYYDKDGNSIIGPETILHPNNYNEFGDPIPFTVDNADLLTGAGGEMLVYLKVPPQCATVKVTNASSKPDVVLECLSNCPIDESSTLMTSADNWRLFRPYNTITTARDLCKVIGLASNSMRYQSIWNRTFANVDMVYNDHSDIISKKVQASKWNSRPGMGLDYFTLCGKGGSGPVSGDVDLGFSSAVCYKERESGRVFALSAARYDKLPDYNEVTALPSDPELAEALHNDYPETYDAIENLQHGQSYNVSDTILMNYYPEIYARKQLNPSNTSTISIFRFLISKIKGEEYTLNGVVIDESMIDWDVAAVMEIYPDTPYSYVDWDVYHSDDRKDRFRYSRCYGKNVDMAIKPFSAIKTLCAITALDYLSPSDYVDFKESDLEIGSGEDYRGAYFTMRDAIMVFMAESNNSIGVSLARNAGRKILESRYGK